MEKIKVNMSPNPLDVQTIHASQNDGEARQWEFELHNNGELIDTSEITEQMFFKSYKGGTEQILPENGSVPTTSPIIADIKYPQGLLTDQEFAYRQSPTESDGNAKIEAIYGNTLKWNQLINDTGSTTTSNGITFTKNADGSITLNGTATAQAEYSFARIDYVNGHKYLINGIPSGATIDGYRAFLFSANVTSNRIITATIDDWFTPRIRVSSGVTVSNVVFKLNIFDLTQMFGAGNEPSTLDEFTSLFPLPYYDFNQGSLLSFNGSGVKTVGKNLLDKTSFSESSNAKPEQTSTGVKVISKNGSAYGNVITMVISNLTSFIGKTFVLSANVQTSNRSGLALQVRDENNVEKAWRSTYTAGSASVTLAITDDFRGCHLRVYLYAIGGSGAVGDYSIYDDLQLEIGTSATSYEPYTESTLSLPIQEHFPNGMNGVNDVHDELRNDGTTLKMYMVNLGTLNWIAEHEYASGQFRTGVISSTGIPIPAYNTNFICSKYENGGLKNYTTVEDKCVAYTNGTVSRPSDNIIRIHDTSCASMTASEFKESLQDVYLCYELETPTETSFTTASLVTENAEIPLSNEDGVLIGKCTEQLSSESGFFDAKIKLADEDGECYSNKIQLHIERSPQ